MGAVRLVTRPRSPSPLTVVAVDRTGHALSDLPGDIRREVADATDPAEARLTGRIAELRPQRIRVKAVAPQLLDTRTNRAMFPAEVMAHAVAPEAIAGVIAFLVSDAAAAVSGAILPAYGA